MENATRGLIIAGGVLIGIIILSVGVYLYTIFAKETNTYNTTISNIEVQKFNSKFDIYFDRNNITPQEILSAVNLAQEYDNDISIIVKQRRYQSGNLEINTEFLIDNIDSTFSCDSKDAVYNEKTGKLKKVIFIKNKDLLTP